MLASTPGKSNIQVQATSSSLRERVLGDATVIESEIKTQSKRPLGTDIFNFEGLFQVPAPEGLEIRGSGSSSTTNQYYILLVVNQEWIEVGI